MNKVFRILLVMLTVLPAIGSKAQTITTDPVDFMHSNGKIYVVVAVVITILLGLFFYLFTIDRKISKLEKKQ
jgi:CcmD family protein